MGLGSATAIRRFVWLTSVRAARLRQLAQRYDVHEEQVITHALDIFFNLTEELDPQSVKLQEALAETIPPVDEVTLAASDGTERVARFDQALAAYQATADPVWVNVLVDSVLGCLGQAEPAEYDPNLKWGGYYESR